MLSCNEIRQITGPVKEEQECGKTCGFQGFTSHARNPPLGRCSLYCFCSSSALPCLPWASLSGSALLGCYPREEAVSSCCFGSLRATEEATQKAQSQTAGNTCREMSQIPQTLLVYFSKDKGGDYHKWGFKKIETILWLGRRFYN